MSRIDKVKKSVEELYLSGSPNADLWIKWGYLNHVLVVAKNAENLAIDKGANVEFCVAGALLHDIADAVMNRSDNGHEQQCIVIAEDILKKSGFDEKEIETITKEIIGPHSCSDIMPTTLEGKVLATADGMSHFQTDFYTYFCWQNWGNGGHSDEYVSFKQWVLKKIEKDFNKKIFFLDIKERVKPEYEALKRVFGK